MRVLLVEDDPKVARLLELGLREDAFEVERAGDAAEALALDSRHAYDIVLLDYMLPDRSGPEVAAALRTRGRLAPILMLTARDSPEDRQHALDAGVTDFMSKPFRFQELVDRMRALLEGG